MKRQQRRISGNIKILSVAALLLLISFSLLTYQLIEQRQSIALAEHNHDKSEKSSDDKEKKAPQAKDKPKQQKEEKTFPQHKAAAKEDANHKSIYLTFDDGPHPVSMKILDLLDKYNAKATFFLLEPHMRNHPNAVKEIVKRGHSVGMHGVTHNAQQVYRDSQSVLNEMQTGQKTLQELTGLKSHLIRTPYGSVPHMKPAYKQAVQKAGFKMWDWTVDSLDWKYRSAAYVPNVISQLKAHQNRQQPEIILLHDKPATAQHLEQLLKYLQKNQYKMKGLKENMPAYHFGS
ncbi:polysaccharide deacetylase family protein [Bacillus xiapuensis]|uniref:polysaccharide deacetylase family protein n=1 Tax=Bacillus xiapuensis TaxID=2014075 RepID=UPI0012FE44EA|nr:polysaccharide deacetylase family protein [Bacillus xiapuensis]